MGTSDLTVSPAVSTGTGAAIKIAVHLQIVK